eukprot:scaffold7558_cov109-Isochrysis_galbana.AAC.3
MHAVRNTQCAITQCAIQYTIRNTHLRQCARRPPPTILSAAAPMPPRACSMAGFEAYSLGGATGNGRLPRTLRRLARHSPGTSICRRRSEQLRRPHGHRC